MLQECQMPPDTHENVFFCCKAFLALLRAGWREVELERLALSQQLMRPQSKILSFA